MLVYYFLFSHHSCSLVFFLILCFRKNLNANYEIALANTWFIAKSVYPDKFEDVDMTAKTNEIMQVFYGKDLADQIFACPSSFGGYQKIDTKTFMD